MPFLAVALSALLPTAPLQATSADPPEGRVRGVELEARLEAEGGPVLVRVRYRLAPGDAAAGEAAGGTRASDAAADGARTSEGSRSAASAQAVEVPLRAARFRGARLVDLRLRAGGRELPLLAEATEGPLHEVRVRLPAGAAELEASYAVERGEAVRPGRVDLLLPVLLVDWPAVEAAEGHFRAAVTLPADHAVVEAFPTVPLARREVTGGVRYDLDLPIAPSLLRLRGRVGPAPLLRVSDWVDAGVLALLILLGVAAWRRTRPS